MFSSLLLCATCSVQVVRRAPSDPKPQNAPHPSQCILLRAWFVICCFLFVVWIFVLSPYSLPFIFFFLLCVNLGGAAHAPRVRRAARSSRAQEHGERGMGGCLAVRLRAAGEVFARPQPGAVRRHIRRPWLGTTTSMRLLPSAEPVCGSWRTSGITGAAAASGEAHLGHD